ncbi:TPA: hypothetical protein DCR49_01900 [Candidatus Delongbacteria bacterium]|nr:MAG: hypothetical protein A2Y39_05495 [Candidatus Delongbacteria bacterium GWF2_40_14]HAQ60748.1 hypothetical protein [Candidatus Delongbacteria bacterium]
MRKMMLMLLLICAMASFAIYTVGATVSPADNIDWTIQGPTGHPDVGLSDNMFDMISKGKPVMIFFGEDW